MTITMNKYEKKIIMAISGRVDTTTAPELETKLDDVCDIDELIFDFAEVEYISSAGLRVLLKAQKLMAKVGSMKLINVGNEVKEIFDITGFMDILTVE